MKIRAVDYRQYLLNRIGSCRMNEIRFLFKANNRKRQYESHWFNRLFNFKFYNSTEWCYSWAPLNVNDYIFKKELTKVIYHIKLGNELIDVNEQLADGFYEFAKLNGLP